MRCFRADADTAGHGVVLQDNFGPGGLVDGVQVRDDHLRPGRIGLHHDGCEPVSRDGLGSTDFFDGSAREERGHTHHERQTGLFDHHFQRQAALRCGQGSGFAEDTQDSQARGADGFIVLHQPGQAVRVQIEGAAVEWRGDDAPHAGCQ